jgi:hypothetical protein
MAILSSFIEGFKEGRARAAAKQAEGKAKKEETQKQSIFEIKINKEAIQKRIQGLEAAVSSALKKLEAKFDEKVVEADLEGVVSSVEEDPVVKKIAELEAMLAELKSRAKSQSV